MEGLQDVGVAPQQAGDEHGQQEHDGTEDDGKRNHQVTSRRGTMTTTVMGPACPYPL